MGVISVSTLVQTRASVKAVFLGRVKAVEECDALTLSNVKAVTRKTTAEEYCFQMPLYVWPVCAKPVMIKQTSEKTAALGQLQYVTATHWRAPNVITITNVGFCNATTTVNVSSVQLPATSTKLLEVRR